MSGISGNYGTLREVSGIEHKTDNRTKNIYFRGLQSSKYPSTGIVY